MARIRTIKPEFWTDEVIVQLPFEARLLFIGLWNFADDYGGLQDSPDRIRLQIFPGDVMVDIEGNIDLLCAAGLLDRYIHDNGQYALLIRKWTKHQKVDNPGKVRVIGEGYRKLAIPSEARRALAIKYGCQPGERKDVTCYHCGMPGAVHWFRLANGKPSGWVTFPGLEIDHLLPEHKGGANSAENLILSCRTCNRSRGTSSLFEFHSKRFHASASEDSSDSRESSPSPRGGREKEREKEEERTHTSERAPDSNPLTPITSAQAGNQEPAIEGNRRSAGDPSIPQLAPDFEQFLQTTYPETAHPANFVMAWHNAQGIVGSGRATEADLRRRLTGFRAFVDAGGYSDPSKVPTPQSWFRIHADAPYWAKEWEVKRPRTGVSEESQKAWERLLATNGAERDARVQHAITAVGGWSRIAERTTFESPKLRIEFCRAYDSAPGVAA